MRRPLVHSLWLVVTAAGLVAWGCSATNGGSEFGDGNTDDTGSQTSGGGGSGAGTIGTGGGIDIGQDGGPQGQTLVITPKGAQIQVTDGNLPKQAFKATVGGQDVTASVTWEFTRPEVGDIDKTGAFAPTGKVGGIGTLTAKFQKLTADTTVEVFVTHNVNNAGLTPQQMGAFDAAAAPDPGMSIVYPIDGTVFPLAVLAPEIQWEGGGGGDVYRLQLKEKYYTYNEFFTAPSPANHIPPQADWDAVETSGAGAKTDPLNVSLSRMSNGQAYKPVQQTWHVAQGRLHGSVYYWELPDQCGNGNGRILRIKPDSDQPDEFFQPDSCFGCHTVSRNGKRLAAEFDNGNGPLYTLALDQNPVGYGEIGPQKPTGNYIFSAFNDKGDKLLANDNTSQNPPEATLQVVDSTTGAVLNPNAMGSGCGEPAWSPDGKTIAGICGLSGGGWVFDATNGYLATGDVGPDGTSVSNVKPIVQQGGGPGRPAYPSFSPDSKYIAFGRPTQGSRSTGDGMLYLVGKDGAGMTPLTTASSDNRSFNPVFAPLRAGGYYWLVFITRRDYGHKLTGQNRQQLWITAIDDPPQPGVDPSHPPFYVRGQEDCGKSENAYYALDPCREEGQDCTSGVDCCGGQCVKDAGTGKYVCGQPPPPGTCSAEGNACKVKADCCDQIDDCIDGFCQKVPPK
jgi:hypothetical protein